MKPLATLGKQFCSVNPVPANPNVLLASSDEDLAFLQHHPRCSYGATLQDANDARLRTIIDLKTRTQTMLHDAITLLTSIDDKSEDAIDSIKMAISTSKNIMTCHPMDRGSYASVKCVIMLSTFLVHD